MHHQYDHIPGRHFFLPIEAGMASDEIFWSQAWVTLENHDVYNACMAET